MPAITVRANGIGAGDKDFATHANVVRVVLGEVAGAMGAAGVADAAAPQTRTLLECNVDDLDPRVWPDVLDRLLAEGADDAWLTPIVMKKGRPAHTLSVLTSDPASARELIFALTSTLGVRETVVARTVLERSWVPVAVAGVEVLIKLGHRDGVIINAEPEFVGVQKLAVSLGVSTRTALRSAQAAAVEAGLVPGAPLPAGC